MSETVYDTRFLACANGNISNLRPFSQLQKRVSYVKEFSDGKTTARFNAKLLQEYDKHIKEYRNEIIESFFKLLVDHGIKSNRNTLTGPDWQRLDGAWPTHDRHLLAAAIDGVKVRIITSEKDLVKKKAVVKRIFRIDVLLCE